MGKRAIDDALNIRQVYLMQFPIIPTDNPVNDLGSPLEMGCTRDTKEGSFSLLSGNIRVSLRYADRNLLLLARQRVAPTVNQA